MIDGDSYLVELVRYIHCNPVRAGLAANPYEYQWSSHDAYLGKSSIPWLTIDLVLSEFADQKSRARSSSSRLEEEDAPYKYKLKDGSPKFL